MLIILCEANCPDHIVPNVDFIVTEIVIIKKIQLILFYGDETWVCPRIVSRKKIEKWGDLIIANVPGIFDIEN